MVKHLIKGKLEKPDKNVNDLSNDEGAAVTIDGKRKGAYKDDKGKLHIVDTTCTHIGCEVNWNHGIELGIAHVMDQSFPTRAKSLKGQLKSPYNELNIPCLTT